MNEVNFKYNTMPKQVQLNKDAIEDLKNKIKSPYNTQEELSEATTTILLSKTNIPLSQPEDIFLLSKNGLLFKVVGYDTTDNVTTVYLCYWADFKGPQGVEGPAGISSPQDLQDLIEIGEGLVGDINLSNTKYELHIDTATVATKHDVEQIEEELTPINSKLARALLTPMSAPIEDVIVGIDTANGQQNITIGEGLTLENGELKTTGGGGGGASYLHNILLTKSNSFLTLNIITNSPTPFTFATLRQYFVDNGYNISSKGYACSSYHPTTTSTPTKYYLGYKCGYYSNDAIGVGCEAVTLNLIVDFTQQTSNLSFSHTYSTQQFSASLTDVEDNIIEI